MVKSYTKEYELHYFNVDSNLKCTMSTIINILSDIGTRQSEELGGGMRELLKDNITWVFYNYNINVFRYPVYGEILSVKTEPIGFKKFYALRKYEIKDSSGEVIISANSIFLLIDLEKRRAIKVPKKQYEIYGADEDIKIDFKLPRLAKPSENKYEDIFRVRYTDIDCNKHVNNTKYIEWAIETLPENIVNNYKLVDLKVTFQKECKYGESVHVYTDIIEEEERLVTIHNIENSEGIELTRLICKWERN